MRRLEERPRLALGPTCLEPEGGLEVWAARGARGPRPMHSDTAESAGTRTHVGAAGHPLWGPASCPGAQASALQDGLLRKIQGGPCDLCGAGAPGSTGTEPHPASPLLLALGPLSSCCRACLSGLSTLLSPPVCPRLPRLPRCCSSPGLEPGQRSQDPPPAPRRPPPPSAAASSPARKTLRDEGRVGVLGEVGLMALLLEPILRCASARQRGRWTQRRVLRLRGWSRPVTASGSLGIPLCVVRSQAPEGDGQPATQFHGCGVGHGEQG